MAVVDVGAVDAVARNEPRRRVMHLVGRTVRATHFETTEAAFEVSKELTERGDTVVVGPSCSGREVRAEHELGVDTGCHAVVESAFGDDVDVTCNNGNLRVLEGRGTNIVGVDEVEACNDVTADSDLHGDKSGRAKECLFHMFLAKSALAVQFYDPEADTIIRGSKCRFVFASIAGPKKNLSPRAHG